MKKTAVITGGSRGIGYACAKQLGHDGYNVVIVDMNKQEDYQENFDALTKEGIDWIYIHGNICSAEDRENVVKLAVEKFGKIDVLVNDAGVAPKVRNDLLDMTEDSFDRVVGINTKGTMFFTQRIAKQMITQPIVDGVRGAIVNVSSCSAEVSSISRGEYCISKAGVSMLTTLYADRLAKEGITVNEVRPGVIATDMTSTVKDKYNKMFAEGVFPIARWGQPEDIALAVSAFAEGKFPYTTGNYVDIDGGFHIKRL